MLWGPDSFDMSMYRLCSYTPFIAVWYSMYFNYFSPQCRNWVGTALIGQWRTMPPNASDNNNHQLSDPNVALGWRCSPTNTKHVRRTVYPWNNGWCTTSPTAMDGPNCWIMASSWIIADKFMVWSGIHCIHSFNGPTHATAGPETNSSKLMVPLSLQARQARDIFRVRCCGVRMALSCTSLWPILHVCMINEPV